MTDGSEHTRRVRAVLLASAAEARLAAADIIAEHGDAEPWLSIARAHDAAADEIQAIAESL